MNLEHDILINEKVFKELLENDNLKNLKQFSIYLPNTPDINDQYLKFISSCLTQNFPNLTNFILQCGENDVTNEGV